MGHNGSRYPTRLWLSWVQTVGAMIDEKVLVQAHCRKCRTAFKVDLETIRYVKGSSYSLIDQLGGCRLLECDGMCFFLYSPGEGMPFRPLLNGP